MMTDAPVHGTTVARWCPADGWRGVLLTGPSGSGKSDLALRLAGRGWRLVADDYSHVFASGGSVYATAPAAIAGRMEVRGLGIVAVPALHLVRVCLVVDCVPGPVERLPDRETTRLAGVSVTRLQLAAQPASAVEIVAAAIVAL